MIHLTGHNYSSRDIIQNIFSPLVGVLTSPLADDICSKNHLTFIQLMQPFARLQNEAEFRDINGTSVSIRGLRINFCDVDWRPPQTVLARKMLNEAVTHNYDDRTRTLNLIHNNNITLDIPITETWFEEWRETFLTVQFPSDHEFTRHLLSCLIVLSSGDPNIIETAQKLTQRIHQMQTVTPQKLPKWFHPNAVLNSYIVLHEGCHGDLSRAQQSYELLKSTFGDSKCFLIQINSLDGCANTSAASGNCVPETIPDYWSPYIKQPRTSHDGVNNSNSTLNTLNSSEQVSSPRTPQEAVGITNTIFKTSAMTTHTMSPLNLTSNLFDEQTSLGMNNDATTTTTEVTTILHPLSPLQEHSTTDFGNSKLSISSESITSQNINPNVWAGEVETSNEIIHGKCLNAMDIENLRHFVQDYTVRALIPYVEHLVIILNDAITNRKGVSKSLLNATKRWFVSNKPGVGTSNQNAVIYTQESVELQTRKLGDLYFLFNHYNMAFQAYHQAKRDFNIDAAWQYYAGALEMAALAAFMLGTANRKTYDYIEDAIVCYLNICKLPQFATRATLLSVECLKSIRLYSEAAKQLMRMVSEDSDLRSALLIEQAAYCFLACSPAMYRQYAFQIVLAGNRFSRAGQRRHAYRCYSQAYQVLRDRGWSLAEDHIQYTLAKQAYMLKRLDEASRSYARLLRPDSLQTPQHQCTFLKEYMQTQIEYLKNNPQLGLLELVIPQVQQDSLRILTMIPAYTTIYPHHIPATNTNINDKLSDEAVWNEMEEQLEASAINNTGKSLIFKPTRTLFTCDNPSADKPIAIQGECIDIAVDLNNSMYCGLILTKIDVLWRLQLENGDLLSNTYLYENSTVENPNKAAIKAAVICNAPNRIVLKETTRCTIHCRLTMKLTGILSILGLVGEVLPELNDTNLSIFGLLQFETQIYRSVAAQKTSQQITLFDQKLNIQVIPSVPSLSANFNNVCMDLIIGEIVPVNIILKNEGKRPIADILLSCDKPRWFTIKNKEHYVPLSILNSLTDLSQEKLSKDKEIRKQRVYRLLNVETKQPIALSGQESTTITAWIQAPFQSGEFDLRLLIYYSVPVPPQSTVHSKQQQHLKYRLIRHKWIFNVHDCLRSEVTCIVTNMCNGDLGLNIQLMNESKSNEMLKADIYINSLTLNSNHFTLSMDASKNLKAGSAYTDVEVKSTHSRTIQCHLKTRNEEQINSLTTLLPPDEIIDEQRLGKSLSTINIENDMSNTKSELSSASNIPKLEELYSFLMNYETVYFKTNLSNEDFSNIMITAIEPYLTFVINWTATITYINKNVKDITSGTAKNNTNANQQQRIARGQHFMKLKKMYEKVKCPEVLSVMADYTMNNELISNYNNNTNNNSCDNNIVYHDNDLGSSIKIIDLALKTSNDIVKSFYPIDQKHTSTIDDCNPFDEEDDSSWEQNDNNVGQRCLLVDELFFLNMKA